MDVLGEKIVLHLQSVHTDQNFRDSKQIYCNYPLCDTHIYGWVKFNKQVT